MKILKILLQKNPNKKRKLEIKEIKIKMLKMGLRNQSIELKETKTSSKMDTESKKNLKSLKRI